MNTTPISNHSNTESLEGDRRYSDTRLFSFYKLIKKLDKQLIDEKSRKYSFNFGGELSEASEIKLLGQLKDNSEFIENFDDKENEDTNSPRFLHKKRQIFKSNSENVLKISPNPVTKEPLNQAKNVFKSKLKISLKSLSITELNLESSN